MIVRSADPADHKCDRQTDRQTDRQADRQTGRQTLQMGSGASSIKYFKTKLTTILSLEINGIIKYNKIKEREEES